MNLYEQGFAKYGLTAAQVLLTEEDFSNRKRYLNLRHTLMTLLEMGVIPIINENDTVSTTELEVTDRSRELRRQRQTQRARHEQARSPAF